MAYKFQLGNAKLGGTLQQDGGLVTTDVDDGTAANIVAQIDNGEIAHTKVALEDGDLLIGDGSGLAQNQTVSGDATLAANGALTIAADAVTYAKIQNVSATNRILGRDSAGAGIVEEISPADVLTMLGVESGATADQTNAEIRAAVEAATDSNVFTDADHTKLNGVEASAKDDQTALEIIALLNSDLNADFSIGNQADNVAQFGGPVLSSAGVFELGEGQNGAMSVRPTAHGVAGKDLAITAGATTAGTTDDIAGGKVQINGGQGKGTGVGGAIEFNVATAAGSTGNSLNAYANALVIAQDKNAQFKGNLTVDGDLLVSGDTVTMNVATMAVEDKDITLGSGNSASEVVNGTGIILEGGSADDLTLLWNTDKMELKKGASFADIQAGTFTGALAGNATTATTLASARTIGGVSFNGSAAIVPNTITVLDEENTNADRLIMFADAAGAQQPKNDGDLKYNPSTGRVTATAFAGSGEFLTGLPAGNPGVNAKTGNGAGAGVALSLGVNVLTLGSDAHHVFRLPNAAANGDRIWIKAPSNAAAARTANITGSLAGPGLTIDGAASIRLESADAAVCLVYVGSSAWRVF